MAVPPHQLSLRCHLSANVIVIITENIPFNMPSIWSMGCTDAVVTIIIVFKTSQIDNLNMTFRLLIKINFNSRVVFNITREIIHETKD